MPSIDTEANKPYYKPTMCPRWQDLSFYPPNSPLRPVGACETVALPRTCSRLARASGTFLSGPIHFNPDGGKSSFNKEYPTILTTLDHITPSAKLAPEQAGRQHGSTRKWPWESPRYADKITSVSKLQLVSRQSIKYIGKYSHFGICYFSRQAIFEYQPPTSK